MIIIIRTVITARHPPVYEPEVTFAVYIMHRLILNHCIIIIQRTILRIGGRADTDCIPYLQTNVRPIYMYICVNVVY